MPCMSLGIRAKLFLAFLLCTLLVIISMMLYTRWSIESGFIEYVENRQAENLQRIAEELTTIYAVSNSWGSLKLDKRLWVGILFEKQFSEKNELSHQDRGHNKQPRLSKRFQRFFRDDSRLFPPDKLLSRMGKSEHPPRFEHRIMLFDANDQAVFGRADMLDASTRYPLSYQGNNIGFIALIKGPSIADIGQIQFIEKQRSSLIFITLCLIALSALIALVLAHRFITPLQAFRHTVRQLASGQYSNRINIKRSDELGDVATDINALAEVLQANEADRRQWVADIAHELRTPLSIMQSELEALQDDIRPLDKAAINSLHTDALRLGRLIDDLYELSMTDLGALSYRKIDCDVGDVLMETIDDHQSRFDESDIIIQTNLHELDLPNFNADPQRLTQLFNNLLENTLRYTDAGGQLHIQVTLQAHQLTLDFQDSSPGVSQDDLPHLFERLYRVEVSRNRTTGGAGLGLAISKNIIEAHHGDIKAMVSPLGGLWVQVTLPRKEEV